jgi:alpha-L-rhamnosidase
MLLSQCKWITKNAAGSDAGEVGSLSAGGPAVVFTNQWTTCTKVRHAKLQITALGLYHVLLNGQRITPSKLNPGWTDYNKRLQFQEFDITPYLHQENTIEVTVGDGWYFGNIAHVGRGRYGEEQKSLLALITISDENNHQTFIPTDSSWQVKDSNIVENDIIMGEKHDFTRQPGHATHAYEQNYQKHLVPQMDSLVVEHMQREPIDTLTTDDGSIIYDFGQNMVGWCQYVLEGNPHDQVIFQYAEILEKGDIYTTSLRAAKQTDTVILSGGIEETFTTLFTYHGFRYVKVSSPQSVSIIHATGYVAHSGSPITSQLKTSHHLVNQLIKNIQWSQRGNFVSIPTDCPQRNERMGWLGDAQIFCKTALYNMDCILFFKKYLNDLRDGQRADGALPDVVPFVQAMGIDGLGGDEYMGLSYGTAAWADAAVIIPYHLYHFTNDHTILQENYQMMCDLISYYEKTSDHLIRDDQCYGDWLSVGEETNKSYLATAYFYYSTCLLSKISETLGLIPQSKKYCALSEEIRQAIVRKFLANEQFFTNITQTECLLALKFHLAPDLNEKFIQCLTDNIIGKNYCLSTGFIGVSYLLPMLTEYGYPDVAYKLLVNEQNPSWLYSVKQGATTMWERWNSYEHDKGINQESMNSFNHYSLGSVGEWLFEYMLGIKIRKGFNHETIIQPIIDPTRNITWCEGSIMTPQGVYSVRWNITGNQVNFDIEVPERTKIILSDGQEKYISGKVSLMSIFNEDSRF